MGVDQVADIGIVGRSWRRSPIKLILSGLVQGPGRIGAGHVIGGRWGECFGTENVRIYNCTVGRVVSAVKSRLDGVSFGSHRRITVTIGDGYRVEVAVGG